MGHPKQIIEAFDAQGALAIEEVRDVRLLESSEVGELEPGDLAGIDALPQGFSQILLQRPYFHDLNYINWIYNLQVQSQKGNIVLDIDRSEKYHYYTNI